MAIFGGNIREMLEAATKRSKEADSNWRHDPLSVVPFVAAKRPRQFRSPPAPAPAPVSAPAPAPVSAAVPEVAPPSSPEWGTW